MRAVLHLRGLRGAAQAQLILAEDGHHYVTKFVENPQGRRILVNELIASRLLDELGFSAASAAIIEINDQFLAASPTLIINHGHGYRQPQVGPHFGSRCPVDPDRVRIYDLIPDDLFPLVMNREEFLGMLVFDNWVANCDARQAVFYRPPAPNDPENLCDYYVTTMIDNGYIFNGSNWTLGSSSLNLVYCRHLVYKCVLSIDDFEPWITAIATYPEEKLWRAFCNVPDRWLLDDKPALEPLCAELARRRARMPELISEIARSRPDVFPRWRSKSVGNLAGGSRRATPCVTIDCHSS